MINLKPSKGIKQFVFEIILGTVASAAIGIIADKVFSKKDEGTDRKEPDESDMDIDDSDIEI